MSDLPMPWMPAMSSQLPAPGVEQRLASLEARVAALEARAPTLSDVLRAEAERTRGERIGTTDGGGEVYYARRDEENGS